MAEEKEGNVVEDENGLNHVTLVLNFLVGPCARTDQVVCVNSYVASVNVIEEMTRMGLQFISVVRTAIKKYPMAYLPNLELVQITEV